MQDGDASYTRLFEDGVLINKEEAEEHNATVLGFYLFAPFWCVISRRYLSFALISSQNIARCAVRELCTRTTSYATSVVTCKQARCSH